MKCLKMRMGHRLAHPAPQMMRVVKAVVKAQVIQNLIRVHRLHQRVKAKMAPKRNR